MLGHYKRLQWCVIYSLHDILITCELQHLVLVIEKAVRVFSANISTAAKYYVNVTFFGPQDIFCVFSNSKRVEKSVQGSL